MRINAERLHTDLKALARIGALPDGGVRRLAFSREDLLGRDFVADALSGIGLVPRIDAIGNLWAIRPGTDADLAPVLMGSHTDSVGNAGALDGALGVLAALEALRTFTEANVDTRHPIGLVSFVNEEGVRFMPDMMGSLYLRGDLSTEEVRAITGTDGVSIGSELDRFDMAGPDDLRTTPLRAFVELHIEQGPVLEGEDLPIGIVSGVQGLRWLEVSLIGIANHAGTTPMQGRNDAGVVAAEINLTVRELTQKIDGLRSTVGRLIQRPNLINVIPSQVSMTVDLRHPDQTTLEHATSLVRECVKLIAAREGVQAQVVETASAPAVEFAPDVVQAAAAAAGELGIHTRTLISGAGHDAQILAGHCPAGMIFVRSQGGVSHSPEEYSTPEDCALGAQVLMDTALKLAT